MSAAIMSQWLAAHWPAAATLEGLQPPLTRQMTMSSLPCQLLTAMSRLALLAERECDQQFCQRYLVFSG